MEFSKNNVSVYRHLENTTPQQLLKKSKNDWSKTRKESSEKGLRTPPNQYFNGLLKFEDYG